MEENMSPDFPDIAKAAVEEVIVRPVNYTPFIPQLEEEYDWGSVWVDIGGEG